LPKENLDGKSVSVTLLWDPLQSLVKNARNNGRVMTYKLNFKMETGRRLTS